ncbi:DUF1934 domain-containing protein [Caldalkalibacillus mannanilyticus]|uniref:DUF1934 domain-containing protein n=1 Tax=Caldalkalibacillus mannanilyticus TaxID=1418 RepID=UPI0004683906|nr:DUF1934 domain-containing protein [Caldalkalibacillus mannanilyticus]
MNGIEERQEVLLKIHSRIEDGQQVMEEQQELQGRLVEKEGITYLQYTEIQDEGLEIHNTLKIQGNQLQLIRHGAVRMNHLFRVDEETESFYLTPHGRMKLETKTKKVEFMGMKAGLSRLTLRYDLNLGGTKVGQVKLFIEIKEKG